MAVFCGEVHSKRLTTDDCGTHVADLGVIVYSLKMFPIWFALDGCRLITKLRTQVFVDVFCMSRSDVGSQLTSRRSKTAEEDITEILSAVISRILQFRP